MDLKEVRACSKGDSPAFLGAFETLPRECDIKYKDSALAPRLGEQRLDIFISEREEEEGGSRKLQLWCFSGQGDEPFAGMREKVSHSAAPPCEEMSLPLATCAKGAPIPQVIPPTTTSLLPCPPPDSPPPTQPALDPLLPTSHT